MIKMKGTIRKMIPWDRIGVEKKTVRAMIRLYCRGHRHGHGCVSCMTLEAYAMQRLERCPFGAKKPDCKHCPVHCYKPAMRDEIRQVMRYAGPRMIWHHPWLALQYKMQQILGNGAD